MKSDFSGSLFLRVKTTLTGLAVFWGGIALSWAGGEFRPTKVANAFPAIMNPVIVPADEAENFVEADELALGVVIDGLPRAYPVNMLTNPTREIINDRLGGVALAATW